MNLRDYKTAEDRRKAFEKELGICLENIGATTEEARIENRIGATHVPMGIAGPLNGKYIPLATTEGALVASISRGCKAITGSGGATVSVVKIGATRGPVFKVKNLSENSTLYEFITKNKKTFNVLAQKTSGHITLTDVYTNSVGLYRFVRFTFDTQDAMGMNMVTIATQKIVEFIEKQTGVRCVSLAGNFDVDKKPSWFNVTHGRGFEVWAEAVMPQKVLHDVLKTTAQKMYEVWLAKCMIGSAIAGSMAFNAQFANVIAAVFLATGQDAGHIGECSVGMTTAEMKKDDLYISVYIPDLMVGTVGGGTGLATQKEALSIIGAKNSREFAEVVAGVVLAGEISLLASLSEGTIAKAHQRYGRNR